MPHGHEKPKPGPRFLPGKVRITKAAETVAGAKGVLLLARHIHGDWGDIPPDDALQNELAVLLGLRIQSRYDIAQDAAIWITTEADRATTTIIFVESIWTTSGSG